MTQTQGSPVLRMKGITKSYGDKTVLHGVDLEILKGETVCLIGPSGSGKSTLLRCANLLEWPDSGEVCLSGTTYYPAPKKRRGSLLGLRTGTAMVFQDFQLFPHLTATENVTLAPIIVGGLSKEEARDRAVRLLDRVGLGDLGDRKPGQLSGGQQQRVAIARAMAMQPELLLFDEPTSALDPETVGEVLQVMLELAKDGTTMVVVTHEMRFAREVGSTVVVMDDGRLIESGDPKQVFTSPQSDVTKRFLAALEFSGVTQTGAE